MCKILGLCFHAAARACNHKAVNIERFFCFLNQAMTINTNDRGTNQVFIESTQCATFAWNSSPINSSDIVRSIAAVGRKIKFPLDISLQESLIILDADVYAVHSSLRLAQAHSTFSVSILALLTK
jgi:hypothetical protein